MVTRIISLSAVIFIQGGIVAAGKIREFDVKTLVRLGNELTQVSQTSDKGATSPVRKRAQQTAKAALRGKLFDIHYDYVVLDDPDGSGSRCLAATGLKRCLPTKHTNKHEKFQGDS